MGYDKLRTGLFSKGSVCRRRELRLICVFRLRFVIKIPISEYLIITSRSGAGVAEQYSMGALPPPVVLKPVNLGQAEALRNYQCQE